MKILEFYSSLVLLVVVIVYEAHCRQDPVPHKEKIDIKPKYPVDPNNPVVQQGVKEALKIIEKHVYHPVQLEKIYDASEEYEIDRRLLKVLFQASYIFLYSGYYVKIISPCDVIFFDNYHGDITLREVNCRDF